MTDPMIDFWARQPVTIVRPSTTELDDRARTLVRGASRRDRIEHATGAALILLFGWFAWRDREPLFAAACAAIMLGIALVMVNLHRRRAEPEGAALGQPIATHYRALLVHQRDMLAAVPRWYIAPIVPGLALFVAAIWLRVFEQGGAFVATIGLLPSVVVMVAVLAGVMWLNRRAAARLQSQIDALYTRNEETRP